MDLSKRVIFRVCYGQIFHDLQFGPFTDSAIHLLINDIGSKSLREIATSLKSDSKEIPDAMH